MHETREDIEREVVVITGASGGVGRATAREFARHGAAIALLARGSEGLDEAAREVEALGGIALAIRCDVAVAEDVFAAAEQVERELGPIDVWVNNAMVTVFGPVSEIEPEELRRVTDVTYHGQAFGTMAALRHMTPRNRGSIVSVGSALAYRGIPLQAAYCGAKHAIVGFLDSVRSELIHDDVDVNITEVHLPGMNTPQFEWSASHLDEAPQPVPPIYQPEEAARTIYWAAHHRRRDVYVGYPTYKTIIGAKLLPGFLDRYLARKAYDAQMRSNGEDGHRGDGNLFFPAPSDHGAHGPFENAKERSLAIPLASLGAPSTARLAVMGGAIVLAAFGLRALAQRALNEHGYAGEA